VTEQEQQQIFKTWLDAHKGILFKIIRAYAHTTMDRDDLFQEISFQVWRSVPAFRNESAVTTWLYRIALNTSMSWIRKERKHYEKSEPDVKATLYENSSHEDDRLAWLYHEISKLNEMDKSITLLMLDGLSYKEMAAITGLTESNIGVRINRMKKNLAEQSKTYHHGI
jgi:RNA polymerase sigma-70 factor, ECF subfamily